MQNVKKKNKFLVLLSATEKMLLHQFSIILFTATTTKQDFIPMWLKSHRTEALFFSPFIVLRMRKHTYLKNEFINSLVNYYIFQSS